MYKIYKTKSKTEGMIYYVLCEGDNAISWFYFAYASAFISYIYKFEKPASFQYSFSFYKVECIYESSDFQEASDQLEQLRILLSV